MKIHHETNTHEWFPSSTWWYKSYFHIRTNYMSICFDICTSKIAFLLLPVKKWKSSSSKRYFQVRNFFFFLFLSWQNNVNFYDLKLLFKYLKWSLLLLGKATHCGEGHSQYVNEEARIFLRIQYVLDVSGKDINSYEYQSDFCDGTIIICYKEVSLLVDV